MVPTLRRFSEAASLGDSGIEYFSHYCFDESRSVRNGTIQRDTRFPTSPDGFVLSGPHFFVGNPLYKTPRRECTNSSQYEVVDLTAIPPDYLPRTNYIRANVALFVCCVVGATVQLRSSPTCVVDDPGIDQRPRTRNPSKAGWS